jgi:transposase
LPGSGGKASSANCKLQAGYEYKKGELCFCQITAGTKPDNKYTDQLPTLLHKNDLAVIDQGYFKLKTFQSIDRKGAFYLTRLLVNINVRDAETMTRIELANILKKLRQDAYQMHVIMENGKEEVYCRLICFRVSEQVAAKRRRRLKKEARKKGRNVSQRYLSLCDWTLMVTNVPEKLLPSEMVYPLYRLRWQIELIFKQLKSLLCIHQSVSAP